MICGYFTSHFTVFAFSSPKFYLQNQDYLKMVSLLEPQAQQNPLREELYGLLMSAPEITKLYYQLCSTGEVAKNG